MLHHTISHTTGSHTSEAVPEAQQTSSRDELLLLQRVIAQDEEAFATLYRRYTPLLQRFLRRFVPHPGLVDEVLDDVMLVLWQDARRFPPTVPLAAWLYGIARHKAYKALRRQQAAVSVPAPPEDIRQAPADPETSLLHNERATQLAQELAMMAPTDRLLLEKLLYQGCSYQEMAAQTSTPLNTVKVKLMRARQRLAKRFPTLPREVAIA